MSDSSDDDDDLFQPVFCKNKSARQAPSHTRPTKTTSVEPPPQKFASTHQAKSLCLEEIQQKAKNTAYSDWILPSGISNPNQLVWYKYEHPHPDDEEEQAVWYIPCRICEASEARQIRLAPNSWNAQEVSLVQALLMMHDDAPPPFATRHNRILAENTSLIPYHGGNDDNVSTMWCPKLLQRFHQEQRRLYASCSTCYTAKDEWTTFYFLQRILQHAQQQQQQQQEEVSLESEVDDKRCSTATTTTAACARNEDKKEDSTNKACPGDDDHHHHSNDTTTTTNSSSSSSTTTSSIASDDLQVPYDEHLLSDENDDNDYLDETLFDYDEPSNEPLRPGDVITYTLPVFTAGDARGRRVTTVLSTDPHRHPVLVLQNGDVLPPDTSVKRICVREFGTMYPHKHGYFRPIASFCVEKRGRARVVDGFRREGKRVDGIVQRNLQTFAERQQQEGFAPMDLFHRRRRKQPKPTGSTTTTTVANRNVPPSKPKRARNDDDDDDRRLETTGNGQPAKKKRAVESKVATRANDSDDSSSTLDVEESSLRKQSMTTKSRTLYTKRLLAKMKEKGTAAFDSSDSDEDGRQHHGGEQVARKPVASTKNKSSKHVVKQQKKQTTAKSKACSKPVETKATSKSKKKGGIGAKAAMSTKTTTTTTTTTKKRDSRKSSGNHTVRNPPAVSEPGEWMTTRRTARESLGVDSDVTSLASLRSEERRGSPAEKQNPHESSQRRPDSTVAPISKQRNAKRKARDETLDEPRGKKSNRRDGNGTAANKRQKRLLADTIQHKDGVSTESDSSIDAGPFGKKSSAVSKPSARSSSPMQDDENSSDLINSPRRKREKPKRAKYASGGKTRVELGSSSSKRHGTKPARSMRKDDSVKEDSMSFHASSSDEDDSSVEITKFTNRPPEKDVAFPKAKRSSASRNKGTIDVDSDSSIEVVAVANHKSPVLDLTRDKSGSADSSDEENPVPPAKRNEFKKRDTVPRSKTAKTTSTMSFSAVAAQPAKPFGGLSFTKHNVRKKRPKGKKINKPSASNRTMDDSDDDLDTRSARKQRAANDCCDWGTTHRGNSTLSSSSRMGLSSSKSIKSSRAHSFQSTASQGTNRFESQASASQRLDPFAKNAGDEELVDSSDDDSLLNSDSQKQSLPRKRLFQSEQWKGGSSQGSYAAAKRLPVASSNMRQNRRH